MADVCVSAIKACRIRLTRLDACGSPVVGPKSVITSKGFISVVSTADIEAGQEYLVKDACGDLCINEKDCDRFKRLTLALKFCLMDAAAAEIMTGNRVQVNGDGDAIGFTIGENNNNCDVFWSMELWQKIAGQPCDVNGDPEWSYWAWPYLQKGTIGNLTFDNNAFEFDVDGVTSKGVGSGTWGDDNRGPFNVLEAENALLQGEHVTQVVTSVQPPAVVCGYQPYAVVTAVPDAPTMELAARASATSATVVFDAPAEDGGSPITGYTVISSPGGLTSTGTSSPRTVTGLTTGTPYTFTVHATNAIGNSAESTASNSVTP